MRDDGTLVVDRREEELGRMLRGSGLLDRPQAIDPFDLARAVLYMLGGAGTVLDEEEAKEWASRTRGARTVAPTVRKKRGGIDIAFWTWQPSGNQRRLLLSEYRVAATPAAVTVKVNQPEVKLR
jgi:hypothetical protein